MITVYDGTTDPDVFREAAAIYREVYAEPPYFETEQDFRDFADDLPRRAEQIGFRLAVARIDGWAVGFALGHRLPVDSRWWEGALSPIPDEIKREHEGRTFALIELAVRQSQRQRGLGRRLHNHVATDLKEERVTLLVRPDAKAARTAYHQWGYRKVGSIRPFPGAPTYDAMVRNGSERHGP